MSSLYRHDQEFREKGFPVIAGIDEAGRGPLAGPVVAAAVILPPEVRIAGLRDSKKVPEQERRHLFWEILTAAEAVGVGWADHVIIDRINILQATRCAMQTAVDELRILPSALIIDAVRLPSTPIRQFPIIKADALSAAVAAASIVAKYVRDTFMVRYHAEYPEYHFDRHKGYATNEHIEMIRRHGLCPIHRTTFRKAQPGLPF